MPTAIPGAAATTTVGLVGSMTGTQEVANPGLKRMRALQEAKAAGRNCFMRYEMSTEQRERQRRLETQPRGQCAGDHRPAWKRA